MLSALPIKKRQPDISANFRSTSGWPKTCRTSWIFWTHISIMSRNNVQIPKVGFEQQYVPAKNDPSSKLHHSIQIITIPDTASLTNGPQSNRLSVVQPAMYLNSDCFILYYIVLHMVHPCLSNSQKHVPVLYIYQTGWDEQIKPMVLLFK